MSALRTKGTYGGGGEGLKGGIKTTITIKKTHRKILAKTEFLPIFILFPRLNNNSYLFLEMILSLLCILE